MAKPSLRAAVIGVGYLGNFHAQKMKALSTELGFQFVGICDASNALLETRSQELGVKGYSAISELVKDVDLVTVATTTPAHFEIAKYFLENGKHVNVEKPICLTSREAQVLVDLAEKKNLILSVGHSERFSKVFTELKAKMVKPQHLEFVRHAPFKRRGAEVSVVLDLMIHDLDLLLSLDSSDYQVQSAALGRMQDGGVEADWALAALQFRSGLTATISIGRMATAMTRTIRVFEAQQTLLANFQSAELEIGKMTTSKEALEFTKIEGLKSDNLLLETRNFIRACQHEEKSLVPGTAGLRALKCAEDVIAKANLR